MIPSRRGSLLVITLWLVAMVSLIAIAVARSLSLEVRVAKYRAARAQVLALARGGVYLALTRLADDTPEADGQTYDWLGDDWAWMPPDVLEAGETAWAMSCAGETRGGRVRVQIVDEAGKMPLNTMTKEQLLRLVTDVDLAQAIVDARDGPDHAEDRPDDDPPYFAKNGPFAAPEELADLPGMTPEILASLLLRTSPYLKAEALMNINTMGAENLEVVGLHRPVVDAIVRFRDGLDGPNRHEQDDAFTGDGDAILQQVRALLDSSVDFDGADYNEDRALLQTAFGTASQTFTVITEGETDRPAIRKRVEAVIERVACGEDRPAPCIIAWRES